MPMVTEKYINIQKLNGGFILEYNDETGKDHRKIVRKLSEVVSIVKEQLSELDIVNIHE